MNHPVHHSLKAAYSFYNVHTVTPLLDLMQDALILAKSVCIFLLRPGVFVDVCIRVCVCSCVFVLQTLSLNTLLTNPSPLSCLYAERV